MQEPDYHVMLRLANGTVRIVKIPANNPVTARYMAEAMFPGSVSIGHSYR